VPESREDLSDALDRVSRHELERRVERLGAELAKLRRILAPLARFRTLVDQAGEAMFVIDAATGRFVDVNETALRWLGLARNKLLTLTVDDVHVEFPLEYRETRTDHVTDTRNLDRPWIHSEGVHRRRDGSCFPVDVAVAQRRFGDRAFTLVVARESKRRQSAEQALREAQESYHTLFDLSHDAIYLTARDGRIANANRAAIEQFGYAKQDFIGLEARLLYADVQDIRRFQEIVEEDGFVRDIPVQFRTRDGSLFLGLLTATLRHTGDGAIGGYQCLVRRGAVPPETSRRSADAGGMEGAVDQRLEQSSETGITADSVTVGDIPGRAVDEDATPPGAESWDGEVEEASPAELAADSASGLTEPEEQWWNDGPGEVTNDGAPRPDAATPGSLEDGATGEAAENELGTAPADQSTAPAEASESSDAAPGTRSTSDREADIVFNRMIGSAYGYEVHEAVEAVHRSQHRSPRKRRDAGRKKDEVVTAAPWLRKPAPPPVVSERRSDRRWSLLTLGALLSLVGWSDVAVVTFPYDVGVQEWQYALRVLGGALVVLGIAVPRSKGAARAIAAAVVGLTLVMLVSYVNYLLDFPFGLEDVVPDAELDAARRRASEFTAVTVLGCVWIAGFLWRIGRAR
jgi:PAS domain S-box-containing protein